MLAGLLPCLSGLLPCLSGFAGCALSLPYHRRKRQADRCGAFRDEGTIRGWRRGRERGRDRRSTCQHTTGWRKQRRRSGRSGRGRKRSGGRRRQRRSSRQGHFRKAKHFGLSCLGILPPHHIHILRTRIALATVGRRSGLIGRSIGCLSFSKRGVKRGGQRIHRILLLPNNNRK
jgi:hypothetical protein